MGSIVAILCRSAAVTADHAERMLRAAPHRGTDYEIREVGDCILGVCNRGDAVDSAISSNGRFAAVFSGRLDNSTELYKLLSQSGQPPRSTDPADIAIAAIKAFGLGAPNRMRGVFAGVVTDGHCVWCFRDHLGLKSLYYREDPKAFFLATEAKQIIAGAGIGREPNLAAIEDIFYRRKEDETACALQGVNRLPQATTFSFSRDRASDPYRYWRPVELLETVPVAPQEVGEKFNELFAQAVRRSLTAETVISLSGGIDSSAVAAFAAPQHLALTGRPLTALSAVFPNLPKVDESAYIRMIVDYLGMDLRTYEIKAGMLDDVQEWCNLLDGPIPTVAIPEMHENFALARQLGFNNVLTGELAEFVIAFHFHTMPHLLTRLRWRALCQLMLMERQRGKSRKHLFKQLVLALAPGSVIHGYSRLRHGDRADNFPDWVDPLHVHRGRVHRNILPPAHRRWSEQQLLAFEGSTFMMDADDLCASVSGVTVRRPFVDIDLWEFFLSLPAQIKFPDLRSKTLVRRLLRGKLPDEILDRRDKTVFNDHVMAHVDYPVLRQFLLSPNHHVAGVDYRRLAEHIERQDFKLTDWVWAITLVRIHAFLSLW